MRTKSSGAFWYEMRPTVPIRGADDGTANSCRTDASGSNGMSESPPLRVRPTRSRTGQTVFDCLACDTGHDREEFIGKGTHQALEKHVCPANAGVHEVMEAEGVEGVNDDGCATQTRRHPGRESRPSSCECGRS